MAAGYRRLFFAHGLLASAIAASACASTSARPMLRPVAFPTAPLPPTAIRPSVPGLVRAPTMPEVLQTPYALRGVNYRLGGEFPPEGFDCSGFIRYVFGRNHVDVPRTVTEQFAVGLKVNLKNVQEGDLVFFSTVAPGASHVGLVIDQETFIHAPGAGGVVRMERLDTPYWHDRVVGVRRVM